VVERSESKIYSLLILSVVAAAEPTDLTLALEVPQVDFGSDLDVRSEVVFVGHPVMPVGDCLGGDLVGADELQLRERDAQ
jgi:hypothetical protein